MEQQELVAAVQSRYRLIQEFGQYMNKQFLGGKLTQDHFHDDEVNYSHKRIRLESSDAMIFESYLQELADVYAQTDEVFKDCGMELTSNDSCKPEPTWKMNRDTGYYVFTNKLALPFDFRQTSELLWKLSQILHRQDDRELYDGVGDPENCIALKFRTTSCLESGEVVSVVHRAVGHRYDEGDRLVILWRSFSEGEGLFGGMHSDETGWCVVVPSTDPTQPGTRLQICIRNFPMHFSGAEKDEATVEQFTGWLCASGSEDIAEITSSLQSMLLEEEYL
ncbi:hypothetical protein PHYBOEH_007978 [Phytophthora boehmeriae]|uniref:Uncharacterized protein n=1 Tax=Phytophthora boehmeriae TaxID=109152 RepID=A0A8T1W2W9_9STRA|nr:hypothetical protein PHYBOEH_007978 [Phytophthora boehmeriae]